MTNECLCIKEDIIKGQFFEAGKTYYFKENPPLRGGQLYNNKYFQYTVFHIGSWSEYRLYKINSCTNLNKDEFDKNFKSPSQIIDDKIESIFN